MKYFEVLKSPVSAIVDAKKKRSIGDTVITHLLVSLVFGIAPVLIVMNFARGPLVALSTYLAFMLFAVFFVFLFILIPFMGYLLNKVANILGGNGKFFEGFTALTYGFVPISAGLLAAALLVFVPVVGAFIGVLVFTIEFGIGTATVYRAIKDLYKTDMVTSFVALSVVTMALIISVYMFLILFLTQLMPAGLTASNLV